MDNFKEEAVVCNHASHPNCFEGCRHKYPHTETVFCTTGRCSYINEQFPTDTKCEPIKLKPIEVIEELIGSTERLIGRISKEYGILIEVQRAYLAVERGKHLVGELTEITEKIRQISNVILGTEVSVEGEDKEIMDDDADPLI